MKQERYEEPKFFVYLFEYEDVVTLSDEGISSGDIIPFGNLQTTNLEGEEY